ncbi:hypothetical protein BV25DRAFT_406787 [Artomyces pyxidatus]|uniref:Uncharacterized protein n=1 Tax=Artomyces pyxidatus TaxID=48021 RepID=A0ACB8T4M0_9AGAM|nr:hypothetical protein BV25DRAFT_406787 [Artomyces pyxidatus]
MSRLPPEILSYLFKFVKQSEPVWGSTSYAVSKLSPPPPTLQRLGWIKVSYVCRSWREAALDSPLLWAHPSFCLGIRWAEEMLLRSRAVPIKVTLSNSATLTWEIQCLTEHMSRTKELVLARSHGVPSASLTALLQSSVAPVLDKLVWDLHHDLQLESFSEGPSLSLDRTPCLRKLTIVDTVRLPFSTDWTVHTSLTHLHIRNSLVRPTAFDHEELLSVLSRLPHLESLLLVNCVPPVVTEAAKRRETPVALPRLSHLAASGMLNNSAFFMQHLRVPTSALTVSFGLRFPTLSEDGSHDALQTLLAHQADFTSPLRTAAIFWTTCPVRVWAWRGRTTDVGRFPKHDAPDNPTDLRLHFHYYDVRTVTADSIIPSLPLHDVRVLHVVCGTGWAPDAWLRWQGIFAHVEHILVRAHVPGSLIEKPASKSLLKALLCMPQDSVLSTESTEICPTLLFPRLSALTLTLTSPPRPSLLRAVKKARGQAGSPFQITVLPA